MTKCLLLLFLFMLAACASREHMRETLQKEHPDCFVSQEFEIICPPPEWDF